MISRLALAAIFTALASMSCGPAAPAQAPAAKAAARVEPRASWYGAVVDESTDLVVALSPTALMRDPAYGPIFQRASRLAAARSPGTQIHGTTLEALEHADAIVVGVKDNVELDAVVIVAGVPSGFDAARLVDAEGRALWKPSHEPSIAGVAEANAVGMQALREQRIATIERRFGYREGAALHLELAIHRLARAGLVLTGCPREAHERHDELFRTLAVPALCERDRCLEDAPRPDVIAVVEQDLALLHEIDELGGRIRHELEP